ncbi:pseudouridine synthase [Desmophyllum pertusum]|uniref:Pseudouridine synthase n=1 Tax=Desmophyllum pertusum TaxID=174260 RepID=A0A9W9YF91_9CNID|nr:pseudouridine synthase [Desmophyllum pertusum]
MSFGAECFLHCEREGFNGQIKQTWQDFVVTEIDTQGKLVELINGNISSAKEDDKDCQTINRKGSLHKERITSKECSEGKSLEKETPFLMQISESFEELQNNALKDLAKCLSSEKLKELKEFTRESNRKICIGSKMTKEKRTSLHRNVRLAFPHLLTETIQSEQEGEPPLIFASNDKVYWEFIDLLNDRYQVDRLLCFAHWETRRIPSTLNLDVSCADKQQRTKIHRLLSRHFGSFLESKTFNNPDNKTASGGGTYIQIRMRAKGTKPLRHNNKPTDPRQTENEYTGFVLCKRNKETLEAIHRLSSCLNIQPSAFSYAGIKDKKAITKQNMVVRGITPEQICAIQDHPSLEGIECGSYRRGVSRPLRMGALSGNHFQVVIRNIQCDSKHSHKEKLAEWEKIVEDSVASMSLNGFLNYFGPQRFGLDDKEVNACDIGLAMLQGDTVRAVKLLLTPSEQNPDSPVNSAKRYYCETGDVQGTLGKMPTYKVREVLVLKALHRHGTDMLLQPRLESDGVTQDTTVRADSGCSRRLDRG